MGAVQKFLEHERTHFLDYGHNKAATLRELAENDGDTFAKEMYEYWRLYYEKLSDLSLRLETLTDPQLKAALKTENQKIGSVLKNDLVIADDTPIDMRKHLRCVRWFLRVEKLANKALISKL